MFSSNFKEYQFMSHTKNFHCTPSRLEDLIKSVREWLEDKDFNCEKYITEEGHTLIQIEKRGTWRKFVGMSTALNIIFQQVNNSINIEICKEKWVDKALTATASIVLFWPLVVSTGMGSWEQMKMPELIYDYVEHFLGS